MNRLLPPRRIVPRWRKARFAVSQPEMLGLVRPGSPKTDISTNLEEVEKAKHAWSTSGRVGDLADLLAFAVDPLLRDSLQEPARHALKMESLPPAMKIVAGEILNTESNPTIWTKSDYRAGIQDLRNLLRLVPNDAIGLVDLAQHHLSHGKKEAALRCLKSAFQISPNSVYVIRAIARYWIHLGEPKIAHSFIKSCAVTNQDPWLMASEIAISQVASQPSTQLKKAQRAISDKKYSPSNVTELAAAVGGVEITTNLKESRKLFRLALDKPNDNVLAQAIHHQAFLEIDIDEAVIHRAKNGVFEGRAYKSIAEGDFDSAVTFTKQWGDEESFSSRPRLLESYVRGALGDYLGALVAAENGLRADGNDLSLRGNKAYALAGLLRFDEADTELKVISGKEADYLEPFTNATRGMIQILKGDPTGGILLYEKSLAEFRKRKDEESLTTCYAFLARSSAIAAVEQTPEIVARAKAQFTKYPSSSAGVILKTINFEMPAQQAEALRKVTQWEWDPATNTLKENRELTRKGAPGFIVKSKS